MTVLIISLVAVVIGTILALASRTNAGMIAGAVLFSFGFVNSINDFITPLFSGLV